MKTSDYDYELPSELIAQTPVEPRDASRLMVVHRGTSESDPAQRIQHRSFREVGGYLLPGDLLVLNQTRVIPARLFGRKAGTGGRVELLLLKRLDEKTWEALVRGKGLRPGVVIELDEPGGSADVQPRTKDNTVAGRQAGAQQEDDGQQTADDGSGGLKVTDDREPVLRRVTAEITAETETGGRIIRFEKPVQPLLERLGVLPLPPYIHEPLANPERYQTVYGHVEGSVAASTAGLHFTPDLLSELRQMGVEMAMVTLHIGLDTFRPVKEERVEDHQIHTEWYELSAPDAERVNRARLEGRRIVAVGTTVVRALESAAQGTDGCAPDGVTCGWRTVSAYAGPTGLFIYPGYRFRVVDAMITNFHLPRSTLLMLVSAFAGRELVSEAYREAILKRYRFFSFGDAMLLI